MRRRGCSHDDGPTPCRVGHGFLVALVAALPSAHVNSAFIAPSSPSARQDTSLHQTSIGTHRLTTASGKPVCRYGLGGAARSVQPASLPLRYRDLLSEHEAVEVAPFYFYYNPHRYPAFLKGMRESFSGEERRDVFMASGGTERSPSALDQRLDDALKHCGGNYLDAYVLEYVCPYELASDNQLGSEMEEAIAHVHRMKDEGRVRYVVASTHSHLVGAALAAANHASSAGQTPAFDALMLRYNMSHKNAAESLSLPAASERNIPVLAFTSTRWNRLQTDPPSNASGLLPSTADCLKFALDHPSVDVVLHSARDESELEEALTPLFFTASSGETSWLSEAERVRWREYGRDETVWNEADSFDEYPEESVLGE